VTHLMMNRVFGMPSADTFSVRPIGDFVKRYLSKSHISIDPFARNKTWATFTNDLDPDTSAQFHMDAEDFCKKMSANGITADLGLFDPPYSPRQISEVYKGIGIKVGMTETQSGALYRRVRDALDLLIRPGGIVLSFGWNSAGMGIKRGYELQEILLCAHGGAHNDTICIAEQKPW
jgi:hypothetical protein